jgi:hypothetical protein
LKSKPNTHKEQENCQPDNIYRTKGSEQPDHACEDFSAIIIEKLFTFIITSIKDVFSNAVPISKMLKQYLLFNVTPSIG